MYKKNAVHTRFILITTLKRIHCCKSRFSFRDKGPQDYTVREGNIIQNGKMKGVHVSGGRGVYGVSEGDGVI